MNDTTQSFHYLSPNGDYFEKLFSHSVINAASTATFFVTSTTALPLMLGIIWYEKCGRFRYRTAINKLFSTVCWLIIWLILLVHIPQGIRIMSGPLNETFCDIHIAIKCFLINSIFLTYDAITLLRYIFIFKMPNFAIIDDDFVSRCLLLTVVIVSSWATCITEMSPGEHRVVDFICAGTDPNQNREDTFYQDQPRKMQTQAVVIVASVILHIVVNTNIFLYKRKEKQSSDTIELGTLNNPNNQGAGELQQIIKANNKSLVDLSTQILFLSSIIVMVITTVTTNRIDLSVINGDENYWYLYFLQIVGPYGPVQPILYLTIILIYYWRNDSLCDFILRKVNSYLRKDDSVIVV